MGSDDMLSIVTCAKQGDAFIPIDELTELKVKEPLYVYGSIRVSVRGKPLITDTQWTDIVDWWGGMSNVLRTLSNGTKQVAEVSLPWPGTMLFEVVGDRMTWTVQSAQTQSATLDRVSALRILMREYQHFFERMNALNPSCNEDYDVALAFMSNFKSL